jgi:hypothetical protein
MAIFLELTTEDDGFAVNTTLPSLTNARRPLRGLEIKEETYAYIKLCKADGTEIELLDSSSSTGKSNCYSNFILQSVQDQRMEKQQIIETFGDSYLFLFGEAPRFLQVTAILVNSLDFNWKAEFMENYDRYLRGTKAIEQGARTYLFYGDNAVEGYILNANTAEDANNPLMVQLQFQFFVTHASNTSIRDDGAFPIRSSAVVPSSVPELKYAWNPEEIEKVVKKEGGNYYLLWERDKPLRGQIKDNQDEYTAYQGTRVYDNDGILVDDAIPGVRPQRHKYVKSLPYSVGNALSYFGVPNAYNPRLANSMGLGPTFLPGGVGVGSGAGQTGVLATFGASSYASMPGGFTGVNFGSGAGAGFSSFAGAYAGVGASAGAGAYAGAYTGSSAGAYAGAGYGQSGAFASARSSAGSGYGFSQAQAAALAGGYYGANASLGYSGFGSYTGASYAGCAGAGASISVGGRPTIFSLISSPGTLDTSKPGDIARAILLPGF